MSHRFVFRVEVELERDEGKFISRADLADALREAIEGADPSTVDVDESSYSTASWSVEDVSGEKKESNGGTATRYRHSE